MTDESDWKQYTAEIPGADLRVYVQPYGCVELSQGGDPDEPELVHVCSDSWALVVAAANELIHKRGSDNPTERVAEWYENAGRLAEKARAEGAHTFMALCPDGHTRDLLELHTEAKQ